MPASRKPKPAKPYKDFPLFPHASGQWAKKIRGRLVYFGVWDDPDAALSKYLVQRDYLQAGLQPPAETDGTTLADLCNQFLVSRKSRVESGELEQSTWKDYYDSCELVIKQFGKTRVVDTIRPPDFTKLRAAITARFGPNRSAREITQIRMIFRWGFTQELTAAPHFGADFVKPSKKVLRLHRQKTPPKMYEAAEIRQMLMKANVHTKAWILLGINGAMIQKDLSDLPISVVDFDTSIIDFPRGKTAVERRIPMWPETVNAIRKSIASRNQPKSANETELLFLTRIGSRLVRLNENGTRLDAVRDALKRIEDSLEIKQAGRGFSALRHSFRTVADETLDFPAILRIMGHSDNTISDHYREKISDQRLVKVTEYVRTWLFPESKEE